MSTIITQSSVAYKVDHTTSAGIMITGEVTIRKDIVSVYLMYAGINISKMEYTSGRVEWTISGENIPDDIITTVNEIIEDVKLHMASEDVEA